MPETVPDAPSQSDLLRKRYGRRLTVMEEAYVEFSAALKANGGQLRSLTAADIAGVPPPPDLNAAVKLYREIQDTVERKRTKG